MAIHIYLNERDGNLLDKIKKEIGAETRNETIRFLMREYKNATKKNHKG